MISGVFERVTMVTSLGSSCCAVFKETDAGVRQQTWSDVQCIFRGDRSDVLAPGQVQPKTWQDL